MKRFAGWVGLLLLWQQISLAQVSTTAYTITWAPQTGTIGFNWVEATPGNQQAIGDLASGSCTVALPQDGNTYHLLVSMFPASATAPFFATITFTNGVASVIYAPTNPAPMQLQIT